MRVFRWTLMGMLLMATISACTRTDEKPVAGATAQVSPAVVAASPAPSAAAEAEEGDEILMVWAEVEPDEGAPPLSVQLKADISGGQGDRKVKWDFGDNTPPSTAINPTHTYEKTGTFRATVEVSDSTGDSDSDYVDIEVGSGQ
ncbi:MAG: PKD domain-containing protein [Deltaproteobacteria bacterium]|nr:PKD domain-containing protein [Deltaproteobacteria bacterium]